jgi:hypothetical protein
MTAWRMAFRDGKKGPYLWDPCRKLNVAAIEYGPIDDIDFSKYANKENLPPAIKDALSQLASSHKSSFSRFRWEMKEDDVIYVKKGPLIVGRGTVGPYKFVKYAQI